MESEQATFKKVEGYSWNVTFNDKEELDTIVEVVDEKTAESRENLNKSVIEDLKRHKHVVLYPNEKRVMMVLFKGLKEDKSVKEDIQSLKRLAIQITNLSSSYKVKAITLQLSSVPCFTTGANVHRLLGQLYIANHRAQFKGCQLRNILKVDQDTFLKDTQTTIDEKTFCQLNRVNVVCSEQENNLCEDIYSRATIYAKNMGSLRANMGSTTSMTRICTEMAESLGEQVEVEVVVGEQLQQKGLNLIHAVGRANVEPPALVDMVYRGNPNSKQVFSLVGKGITFDTGGLNIKQALMDQMYQDKCGACTVVAVFHAAVKLQLKINLSCTVAWSENSISNNAYRPSDIITSYKGLTVEIGNTDAEGRLCLADCMSFAQEKHQSSEVIEMSTLTGAMLVALGHSAAGVYGNDDQLVQGLVQSSHTRGEELVALPLFQESYDNIKSTFADMNNTGKTRWAGAGTAAAFLHHFVEQGVKYAHIDIAGYAMGLATSATGLGAQAVLAYLQSKQ